MRILLPPSEAKRIGGTGPSWPTGTELGTAGLAIPRASVATALVDFCGGDPTSAADVLALPARSGAADLATNRAISKSATMPALNRYTGTVYLGLDAPTLTAAARRRAFESVLIFSGLFGVLRADELIPAYRLPVAAALPPIGALTPFWRSVLREELPALIGTEMVLDLRSTDYAAMWRPTGALREQVLSVRVLSELASGALAVISYDSKLAKGRLARSLVSSRRRITKPAHVADAWASIGGRDAVLKPDGRLDLIA